MNRDTVSRRPRIVVAEDDALLRYTLKLIVEKDYELVGEAANGGAAVDLAEKLRPDVILLDISMPVMSGIEAGRVIRERFPEIRVIIVSNHSTGPHVEEAFQVGAHGYVNKASATYELPRAIEAALDGRVFRPDIGVKRVS